MPRWFSAVLLALCVLIPGLLGAKSVHTAEPPLGDFLVNLSEAFGPDALKSQAGIRESAPFGYECMPGDAYCHNDPINFVDRLGLDRVEISKGIVYWVFESGSDNGSAWIGRRRYDIKDEKRVRIGETLLPGASYDNHVIIDPWIAKGSPTLEISKIDSIAREKFRGSYSDDRAYYWEIQRQLEANWGAVGGFGDFAAGALDAVGAPFTAVASFIDPDAHTISGAISRDTGWEVNTNSILYSGGGTAANAVEVAALGYGLTKNAFTKPLSLADEFAIPRGLPARGRINYELGTTPDAAEIYAAQVFSREGIGVRFLRPRHNVRTADLRVPSYGYVDVYTPTRFNSTTIARAIEGKHSQAASIFVNGNGAEIPLDVMRETARRVWGRERANSIQRILFEYDGALTIIERPR